MVPVMNKISKSMVIGVTEIMEEDVNVGSLASRLRNILGICAADALQCAQSLLIPSDDTTVWPHHLVEPIGGPEGLQEKAAADEPLMSASVGKTDTKFLGQEGFHAIGISMERLARHMDMSMNDWKKFTEKPTVQDAWAYFVKYCLDPLRKSAKANGATMGRTQGFSAIMESLCSEEGIEEGKFSKHDLTMAPPATWTKCDHHAYFLYRVFDTEVRAEEGRLSKQPWSDEAKYQMIYLSLKLMIWRSSPAKVKLAAARAKKSEGVLEEITSTSGEEGSANEALGKADSQASQSSCLSA